MLRKGLQLEGRTQQREKVWRINKNGTMSAAGEAGPASEQNDIDQSLRDYAHRLC